MKRIIILFICLFIILSGCSDDDKKDESLSENKIDDSKEVVWFVKPSLDYDYVVYPNTLKLETISHDDQIREFVGYPTFLDYTNDAIFVVKDHRLGIYDYAARALQTINDEIVGVYRPYLVEAVIQNDNKQSMINLFNGLANYKYNDEIPELVDKYITQKYWTNGVAKGINDENGRPMQRAIYSRDFKTFDSLVPTGFGGGGYRDPMWVLKNGEVVNSSLIAYDADGNYYLADIASKNENIQNRILVIDEKNANKNLLLPIISEVPYHEETYDKYYPVAIGLANYNVDNTNIDIIENTYVDNSYINGFYAVTNQEPNSGKNFVRTYDYDNSLAFESLWKADKINDNFYYQLATADEALYGFVDADTNKAITEIIYDDLLYFSEGIAGVCKNGKWAFIDEKGNLLSDFLFEDITPVVDGKSYIQINGYYGILDIKETIAKNIPIKYENLKLDETLKKERFILPLSFIYPKVDSVRIRYDHSTDSEIVGFFGRNEEINYAYVYEVYKDKDYFWYRIGENQWVADSLNEDWYHHMVNKKINIEFWNCLYD